MYFLFEFFSPNISETDTITGTDIPRTSFCYGIAWDEAERLVSTWVQISVSSLRYLGGVSWMEILGFSQRGTSLAPSLHVAREE